MAKKAALVYKLFTKALVSSLLVASLSNAVSAENWVKILGEIPTEKVASLELDVDSIRLNSRNNAEYQCRTNFSNTSSVILATVEMTREGRRRNLELKFYDSSGRLLGTELPGSKNELSWNWSEPETGDKEFKLIAAHSGWLNASIAQSDRWETYSSSAKTGTWSYDKESITWLNNSTVRIWVRTEDGFKIVHTLYADRTYESSDVFGHGAGSRRPVPPDSPIESLWRIAFPKN